MSETLKHIQGGSNRFRFTLIELLIVVAIMGILAALLLPVLSRAKRQAVRVADLNNRHQSTLAIMMYTSDYASRYPAHTAPTENFGAILIKWSSNPRLVDQLDDYVGDFSVWQCLGLPDTALIDDLKNTRGRGVYSNISYFANRVAPDFLLGEPTPNKTTHKNSKASMPILACKVRDHIAIGLGIRVGHSKTDSDFTGDQYPDNPSYVWYTSWGMSDVEGSCIAFMDGHVSWVRGNDLEYIGRDAPASTVVKQWAVLPD